MNRASKFPLRADMYSAVAPSCEYRMNNAHNKTVSFDKAQLAYLISCVQLDTLVDEQLNDLQRVRATSCIEGTLSNLF